MRRSVLSCPAARVTATAALSALLLPLSGATPAYADEPLAPADSAATVAPTAPTDPVPTVAPAAPVDPVPAVQETTVRLSAPGAAVAPGLVPVSVRMLVAGEPVADAAVRLEVSTPGGWQPLGRLLTHPDGLGRGSLRISASSVLRAHYPGSATRTEAVSATASVAVRQVDTRAGFVQALLAEAARHAGAPYVYGATGPSAFDCSGYTRYVFGRLGRSLPRTSEAQAGATRPVRREDKLPGDLLFTEGGGHVGFYAGNGSWWVATKPGDSVRLQRLYTSSYLVGRVG